MEDITYTGIKEGTMEKFHDVAEITEKHLNGHLVRLRVDYEDDITMKVEVAYEDEDQFHLFYDICVHRENESIRFMEHYCNYGRDYINLKRNIPFEHDMTEYFFPHKNDS